MRLTCTCCGATGSIEMFTADTDMRRAIELAAKLPAGVGPVAIRYIGLFRPLKRGLTADRLYKLLSELAAMIESGSVERRGKHLQAAPESFLRAMQQMLDQRERLDLPLTNHNYLVAIVAGDAPKAAAATESAHEETRRQDSIRRGASASLIAAEVAGEEAVRKRLRQPPMTDAERDTFIARLEARS